MGSDLLKFYQEYGFWRGLVAPMMETGTYVFPVAGNHETECKACGKLAKVENENAWSANMGDLVIDTARFTGILGAAPQNVSFGPAAGLGPDGLTTDQSKLSYSFDFKGIHFAVINTDPVGADSHAPTQWLAADLAAAAARGVRRHFVFGHKPAFTYAYLASGPTAPSGLDAAPGNDRRARRVLERDRDLRCDLFLRPRARLQHLPPARRRLPGDRRRWRLARSTRRRPMRPRILPPTASTRGSPCAFTATAASTCSGTASTRRSVRRSCCNRSICRDAGAP